MLKSKCSLLSDIFISQITKIASYTTYPYLKSTCSFVDNDDDSINDCFDFARQTIAHTVHIRVCTVYTVVSSIDNMHI